MWVKFVEWLKKLFSTAAAVSPPPGNNVTPITKPIQQPIVPPPKLPIKDAPGAFVLGVDVAHYQDGIQWGAVTAERVVFSIPKATDGATGVDSHHKIFRRAAVAAGIITSAGYCFNRFRTNPLEQARHLIAVAGPILKGELPFCLDVEWDNSSGSPARYKDGGELDDAGANHIYACLLEIEKLSGMVPFLYTAPGFWADKIKNPERFTRFPLWLNDFKAKSVAELRIPKPWRDESKQNRGVTIWQYGEKKMAGVGGVDLNKFLGAYGQLKAMVKQ